MEKMLDLLETDLTDASKKVQGAKTMFDKELFTLNPLYEKVMKIE
jgi:hypothetical protein